MDNKYKAEMEFLMRLKDLLKEWLGVSKLEKDLKQQVEELSKRITTLSTGLDAFSETVGKYQNSVDKLSTSMINQNLQKSKNYETAVNRFAFLNDSIFNNFKKNDTLRNLFMGLLSCRIELSDFENEFKEATEDLNSEVLGGYLNLKYEIENFIKNQVGFINEEIEKESNDKNSYIDCINYPKANEKFDSKFHENCSIFIEDGIIDQVLKLGYLFPKNFSAKAHVTLKTLENF